MSTHLYHFFIRQLVGFYQQVLSHLQLTDIMHQSPHRQLIQSAFRVIHRRGDQYGQNANINGMGECAIVMGPNFRQMNHGLPVANDLGDNPPR